MPFEFNQFPIGTEIYFIIRLRAFGCLFALLLRGFIIYYYIIDSL